MTSFSPSSCHTNVSSDRASAGPFFVVGKCRLVQLCAEVNRRQPGGIAELGKEMHHGQVRMNIIAN